MTNHQISVCTLYSRRSTHLQNLVQGLIESKMHPLELVIICMNDSLPELPSTPFQIKSSVINSPHKLPLAEARTKASSIANGYFLIFLDVDCIPHPNLVETFAYHLEKEDALYQGSIRYLHSQWRKKWTFETLHSDSAPNQLQAEELTGNQRFIHKYEFFWSLCFAIRKSTFTKIGGFDTRFTGYGGEDTDFSFTARLNKVPFYKISALAYHQFHASYSPPLNHLADIVENAKVFYGKWNFLPMDKWLKQFAELGYIKLENNQIEIVKLPSEEEIEAFIKNS
ncbi:glycosyltransferase family 2 protein [Calothrix sp. CCY 0018]|uniref:glycosyltransferase family 2 protein n=1 Tax=Calothrix sp. CCY 0018 TaxID=3103864 RepID=UPI0039C70159